MWVVKSISDRVCDSSDNDQITVYFTCLRGSWASQVFSNISFLWEGGASRIFRNRSWAWRPQCWQTPCSASRTCDRMYVWLERNKNSFSQLWRKDDMSRNSQAQKLLNQFFTLSCKSECPRAPRWWGRPAGTTDTTGRRDYPWPAGIRPLLVAAGPSMNLAARHLSWKERKLLWGTNSCYLILKSLRRSIEVKGNKNKSERRQTVWKL